MQERAVTAGGSTRPLPRPFLVMATQNPLEMEGTYPLPEAQLDRFLLKALVPFPSADDLVTVLERTTGVGADQPDRVADAPDAAGDDRPDAAGPDRQPRAAPRRRPRRRHPAGRTGQPGDAGALRALRRLAARRPGARAGGQGAGPARRAARTSPSTTSGRSPRPPCATGSCVGYEAVADGVTADVLIDQLLARRARTGCRRARCRIAAVDADELLPAAAAGRSSNGCSCARGAGSPAASPASTARRTSARRVDFADYREYHPGDDYRRIDYPLYARTGHLFIRLFEAEDDVSVRIVLDRSASMGFHGKLDQARRHRRGHRVRRPPPPRHRDAAHRAGRRTRRAASSGATPRAACSPTSPRSTPPARPTSPAPPATCSPGPARSASPSSSPTCSTRAGTGRSTAWSPAAATRRCSTCSPTTSCTPTRAATSRWSTWRPASRCR